MNRIPFCHFYSSQWQDQSVKHKDAMPADWVKFHEGKAAGFCALRLNDGASAQLLEVAPTAGTLVIFGSSAVPHQVLPTRRERLCVAGWLCVQ